VKQTPSERGFYFFHVFTFDGASRYGRLLKH